MQHLLRRNGYFHFLVDDDDDNNNNNNNNNNSSTESKVTLVENNNYKKVPYRLWRDNCSQNETALCSAVLAQSGTGAMVSMAPWPVPGHQRLDSPSESAGCLAARKKNSGKTIADRILNVVCKLKHFRRSLVAPEYPEESLRCNLQTLQTFRMKELPRVRIDIKEAPVEKCKNTVKTSHAH